MSKQQQQRLEDADAAYLRNNHIAQLLDEIAAELLVHKPANARAFLIHWLQKREEADNVASAARAVLQEDTTSGDPTTASTTLSVSVPEVPVGTVDPATLRDWIAASREQPSTVRILDLREHQAGGVCPAAEHMAYSTLLKDGFGGLVPEEGQKLVLASARNDGIAAEVAQMIASSAPHKRVDGVYVLVGGLKTFFHAYSGDAAVVSGYEEAQWLG